MYKKDLQKNVFYKKNEFVFAQPTILGANRRICQKNLIFNQ